MKRSGLLLFALIITTAVNAVTVGESQDTIKHWKTKFETSLGISQTTLTNWAKGGENSVSVKAMLNLFKDYTKGKFTWNNYLGANYMVQKQQSFSKFRKADDRINVFTKAGLYAWNKWDYAGLLEFKSQIAKGYNYPNDSVYNSRLMAPGYFQLSLGMNYKPVDYFSVLISPIGARMTVVLDDSLSENEAFGVKTGDKTLFQAGASVNAIYKRDIIRNVNLMSKLDLFTDYLKHPFTVVIVNWENLVIFKVNKYITLNVGTMLIHDNNIPYVDPNDKEKIVHGARTQFMETITVGFAYSFIK
jgi:hypothetical protein